MKRREAIKSITLSSGAIISSASILGLLQSCTEKEATWKPQYFSELEGEILQVVCDFVLPKSNTPSATEVNVPQFIDLMMKDVYGLDRVEKFQKGMAVFNDAYKSMEGEDFSEASSDKQTEILSGYFDISENEGNEVKKLIRGDAPNSDSDKYYIYSFLSSLRNMTIEAYFQSEQIGEEVLAYDPIPGRFDGCIPSEEVGKVWSL